jgi:hypothetical protein
MHHSNKQVPMRHAAHTHTMYRNVPIMKYSISAAFEGLGCMWQVFFCCTIIAPSVGYAGYCFFCDTERGVG